MANSQVRLFPRPVGGDRIATFAAGNFFADPAFSDNRLEDFGLHVMRSELDFDDLERRIQELHPDILVLDASDGQTREPILGILRNLRKTTPELKTILMIDDFEMEFLVQAVQRGARGLVMAGSTSVAMLAKCIRCVDAGQVWIPNEVLAEVLNAFSGAASVAKSPHRGLTLSPREREVMALVIQGLSNRQIAQSLRVAENTVKKYVYEVFNKTGASSRVELVLQALQSDPAA